MDIYKREFFSLVSIVSLYRRAYCKEVCRFFTADVTKLKSTSRTTKTKSLSHLNAEFLENHTSSHGSAEGRVTTEFFHKDPLFTIYGLLLSRILSS